MQTLGLSDSTPRTENRAKRLFWPTIRNDWDVEDLTRQGFWLCYAVGASSMVIGALQGQVLSGAFEAVFYFLAGIGMRERSRVAAIAAFLSYMLDGLVLQKYNGQGFGVLSIFALALLLSNVRGIFLCAKWKGTLDEDTSPRLAETILDKFVNVMPRAIWPWMRYIFFIYAALLIALLTVALVVPRSMIPT